jgi:serine/threonine-protein kinase
MGAVWLAEHVQLGRQAAIKVLLPELSMKPEVVQRFFNEARAATAIADPGIVQIFDYGQHTDGSAYIVMELLDGEPLDRRVQQLRALPVQDAMRIVRQAASTLGAAHARGIVHRDVKPENTPLPSAGTLPQGVIGQTSTALGNYVYLVGGGTMFGQAGNGVAFAPIQ